MLEKLLSTWTSLSPRDQRVAVAGAVFMSVVLIWFLGVQPAWTGHAQLERELPKVRSDLAQMSLLASEAQVISAQADPPTESITQLRTRLEGSLEQAGLSAAVTQLQVSGSMIEARFGQVPFDKWLYWLDAATRETRLRVVDVAIAREGVGLISGRLAFESPVKE